MTRKLLGFPARRIILKINICVINADTTSDLPSDTNLTPGRTRFPHTLTQEFLLVDLVNNMSCLAEDTTLILNRVASRAKQMDLQLLNYAVAQFGSATTRKFFALCLKDIEATRL